MIQQTGSSNKKELRNEDIFCFPTDDREFYNRFNFRRIVEQKPSLNIAEITKGKTIAIHLHLFYIDLLPEIQSYLNNMPCIFDLFVSIPDIVDYDAKKLQESLCMIKHIGAITIKRTPNQGRDIAPMLCTFKTDLQRYDFMLHIQTKKSPQDKSLVGWRRFILNHLLRSKDAVTYILQCLNDDVGIIAPPDYIFCYDITGWTQNLNQAQKIINRSKLNLCLEKEVPMVKFPQGSMFWCKTDYLKELFNIKWDYKEFESEPLPFDGTVAHALERLFFLWDTDNKRKCCMIYNTTDEMYLRARVEKEMQEHHSDKSLLEKEIMQKQTVISNQENTIRGLKNNLSAIKQCIQEERLIHKKYSEETSTRIKQQLCTIKHIERKVCKYKCITYTLGALIIIIAIYFIL